jgi:hypothetical protein
MPEPRDLREPDPDGDGQPTSPQGPEEPEKPRGRFSVVSLVGYVIFACVMFVILEKLGCRRRGVGVAKTWAQIWDQLPRILAMGAGAGVVVYVMRWARSRFWPSNSDSTRR